MCRAEAYTKVRGRQEEERGGSHELTPQWLHTRGSLLRKGGDFSFGGKCWFAMKKMGKECLALRSGGTKQYSMLRKHK
jgi:hypothetical protein